MCLARKPQVSLLVGCSLTSLQHLSLYQDRYQLVTVHTHGDFVECCSTGSLTTSIMTWYPIQSFYPNTEPTSPCPILIMSSAWLGSDKYQFLSHWFDSTRIRIQVHVFDFYVMRVFMIHNVLMRYPIYHCLYKRGGNQMKKTFRSTLTYVHHVNHLMNLDS